MDAKTYAIFKNVSSGGGGGASGYDELSGGNITEVDGKKVLTPLGGGIIRKHLNVEFTMTATEDGEITYGEEPIAEGELIVGETYSITVNGTTNEYVCYVDEYGQKIIGTFEDNMAIGDWLIVDYGRGYLFCHVFGNVDDVFDISIIGAVTKTNKIDNKYIDNERTISIICQVRNYNLAWHVEEWSDDEFEYVPIKTEKFNELLEDNSRGINAFIFDRTVMQKSVIPFNKVGYASNERFFAISPVSSSSICIYTINFDTSGEYVSVDISENSIQI